MESPKFSVNPFDPDDVRVKLQAASERIAVIERQLMEVEPLRTELSQWQKIRAFLDSLTPAESGSAVVIGGEDEGDGDRSLSRSIAELAADVVNREVRKIRAREVCAILQREGWNVNPTSVSNALHYAANRAKTVKAAPGRGMYAPFAYREELIFDSAQNGNKSPNSDREAV